MQARARFSPSSGPLIWTLFGYLFEPMLDPCSLAVRVWGPIWSLHGHPLGPLLPPQIFSLAHGSLFACPWKPFAALGLHLWRPCDTYLVVSEVILTPISSFHAPHSNKEPTRFQSDHNKSFTPASQSVSQICYKTALRANSSCSSCRAKRGTYV